MEWDIERLLDRIKLTRVQVGSAVDEGLAMEKGLSDYFPQAKTARFSEPCVIVDVHGCIMVWYLPGILRTSMTVSVLLLRRAK